MGGRDSRISEPGALSWQRSGRGGDEKLDGRRRGDGPVLVHSLIAKTEGLVCRVW